MKGLTYVLKIVDSDWNFSHLVGRYVSQASLLIEPDICGDLSLGNPCNAHLVILYFCASRDLTHGNGKLDLAKQVKIGCHEEDLVGLIFNSIGVRYLTLLTYSLVILLQWNLI